MAKKRAIAIYDRRNKVPSTGKGMVEVRIRANNGKYRYISLKACTPTEWLIYQKEKDLLRELKFYNEKLSAFEALGNELTIEVIDKILGIEVAARVTRAEKNCPQWKNFLDFFAADIEHSNIAEDTKKHKQTVLESLREFGKIVKFEDLTTSNLKLYDNWLHRPIKQKDIKPGHHSSDRIYRRTDACVHNYHKQLKVAVRSAFEQGFIDENPYKKIHFAVGKHKERQPLSEEELNILSNTELPTMEAHARDLFIFSAYTGLSYADVKLFNFKAMVEREGDEYFIKGLRQKTANAYYTPLLPPALKILEKYNYVLPIMSNQKANHALHLIEKHLELQKPLTFHVARHTFATLLLNMDVPIEHVQKMLGHSNLKTTLIYAKLQTKTLQRSSKRISSLFRNEQSQAMEQNIQPTIATPQLVQPAPSLQQSTTPYFYSNSYYSEYTYSM